MDKNRLFILVALAALVIFTACEVQSCADDPNCVPSEVELTRIANEMPEGELKSTVQSEAVRRYVAAQEAQARADAAFAIGNAAANEAAAHIQAMTAEAQAARDVLSNRATAQALDASLTRQAQAYHVEETRQAQAYHAEETRQAGSVLATAQAAQATVTAQSVEATVAVRELTRQAVEIAVNQTAEAIAAETTRVVVTYQDEATKVSIEATVTAVVWNGKVERIVKPALTVGGILLFIALAVVGFLLAWRFAQVLEDRARIVRPRSDEGEPIIVIESGQYLLPRRVVNPIVNATRGQEDSPLIAPSVAAQMAATLAQQKTNYAQARQVGQVARAENRVPQFVRVSNRTRFAQPGPIPQGENGQPWADVTPNWPNQVPLVGLFSERQPSLHHIIIGVAPRPSGGGLDVVSSDLDAMMHTLIVGASGWGKSAWLRSFLWQLEKAREPVEIIGLDVSGSELNALAGWDKLRYPVARTVQDSVVLLEAVRAEVKRRMKLYEIRPSVSKLSEYNDNNPDPLKPWVIVADEGAALLNDKRTGEPLRDAIQTARQYGIYCVMATVTANATVIPTALRDQFSTRLAFRTNSGRVVVEDSRPKDLVTKGRCWAQLSGQPIREIQGPWLGRGEFVRTMTGDGPTLALPQMAEVESAQDTREQRVVELLESEARLSDSAIARIVYGYENGRVRGQVAEIRERTDGQGGRTT